MTSTLSKAYEEVRDQITGHPVRTSFTISTFVVGILATIGLFAIFPSIVRYWRMTRM